MDIVETEDHLKISVPWARVSFVRIAVPLRPQVSVFCLSFWRAVFCLILSNTR